MQKNQKGFGTMGIVGLVALVVVGGALVYVSTRTSNNAMMAQNDAMQEKDTWTKEELENMDKKMDANMSPEDRAKEEMMEKGTSTEGMMVDKDHMMADGTAMMGKAGTYESYSPEKLALAEKGKVIIFFHASWCPVCRGLEKEIMADTSKIPEGVHILKIDYDTATALRQKYGVTTQHTFVEVDASGNKIAMWNTSDTLAEVVSQIK